jgi:hypothetical protein
MRRLRAFWSLFVSLLLSGFFSSARGNVLVVDHLIGPYITIQQAIEGAANGDTIEVHADYYYESLIFPPHVSLTLRSTDGRASTILDGGETHRMIESDSLDLTIEGFTFRNGATSASDGGGAIKFAHGRLTIRDCDFRNNVNHGNVMWREFGGAIYAYGWNYHIALENCLFKGNRTLSERDDCGGAIGLTSYLPHQPDPHAEVPEKAPSEIVSDVTVDRCTFIANAASGSGAAVYASEGVGCRIDSSLFVDLAGSETDFVVSEESSTGSCNIEWPYPSPLHQGTWNRTVSNKHQVQTVDPRICPSALETIHESSPAADLPGCGAIGTFPVGCSGPVVLAARPMILSPSAPQLLEVYGYDLDDAGSISLIGPSGQTVAGTDFTVNGTDLSARFDLRDQEAGAWTILVSTPQGEAAMDSLIISPIAVQGLLKGWLPTASVIEGTLFGEGLVPGMTFALRRHESVELYPVEVLQMIGTDSLRIRSDLSAAEDGIYDLDVLLPGGSAYTVEAIAYVGTPTPVLVPEDYATIGEALAHAPPCAEVRVGPGTYAESVTIDVPVRIVGVAGASVTTIRPPSGSRGIHVLPTAGPLTEIRNLTIAHGSAPRAHGGGIFCESPARIEGCMITSCSADGMGGRGGGIFASRGCRIIGNDFYMNSANWDDVPCEDGDPWVIDPGQGGVGGGLYCSSCLVEGNTIRYNNGFSCGGFVTDGIFRGNHVLEQFVDCFGRPNAGAARGEISGNHFDNDCGSVSPYLLVEGPSTFAFNVINDVGGDLCNEPISFYFRGSIDFFRNSLAGAAVVACMSTDDNDEPPPGHFRMRDSIFYRPAHYYWCDCLTLVSGMNWDAPCEANNTESPRTEIPADSIDIACNILDPNSVWYFGSSCAECGFEADPVFCEVPHWMQGDMGLWYSEGSFDLHIALSSPALPQNRTTPGCVDTIGALGVGCTIVPVLLGEHSVAWIDESVRLHWELPADVSVNGFEVERAAGEEIKVITPTPLDPCHSCDFVDRQLPYGHGIVTYRLILLLADGTRQKVDLGQWDSDATLPRRPEMRPPAPNPIRGGACEIAVGLPASDRVRMEAFDASGRRVAVLCDRTLPAGWSRIRWNGSGQDGRPLPAGFYAIRLNARGATSTRKVMVIR